MLENEMMLSLRWSLFACMPKGSHAPRHKIKFRELLVLSSDKTYVLARRVTASYRLPKIVFIHVANETIFSALSTEINNVECPFGTHITLTRASYSKPT